MMLRLWFIGWLALGIGSVAHAEQAPSVAVSTCQVSWGTLPHEITGYGTAIAPADASTGMSLQAAGQVTRFAVTVGTAVTQGEPLLDYALTPAAVATYAQAQATWQLAREQHAAAARLFAEQLATRDQLAQAEQALQSAQATLAALRRDHADRPQITLRAPFDGIVTGIPVSQGYALAAGTPLLTLARTAGLSIQVGIEPADRALILRGASATLTALDEHDELKARVRRVADMIDPQTRLIDVELIPAKPVLQGSAFRARIDVGTWRGWLIPRDALISDSDSHWRVFQIDHGKAVPVSVNLIGETVDTSIVHGPLRADLPLVVAGATQLQDGMPVRITRTQQMTMP